MFEDIFGKHEPCNRNTGSIGDTRPVSFGKIWEDNQRIIDGNNNDSSDNDEYEDLQLDSFEI